ncbi:enoyl-CoA hydratase-related protein [Tepidiforma sp.]|jgi:2-(1,2-epoxy-1,2-dihydrophenyl)acetyl-CoA isomerase|uniref:enoyl-CoA hydratase/isomerase family protein n=1 Tax=Tepidiforma sp. TaxID=2682230 RepID=UPI0026366DD6|nr:enoyl-CoA hydratase-related protein [Tepidiforma sp.]MCX7617471.1 enoyl-CoA hydratase-related protein [Tepidiforma sp.]
MHFRDILYDVHEGVARITLNKPEKLNALSWGSWAEIENAVAMAEADDAVKAVVFTGAGRGFCAGTDLTTATREEDWPARPFTGRAGMMRSRFLATAQVYHCRKPTIAAVNGPCVGAGFSLAMACDIRVAAESARFSAIFVKRAIVADTGSTWLLPRLVGPEWAYRLLYTGEIIDARQAERIGLVSQVAPDEELPAAAGALAGAIARGPSVAIELMKRLVQEGATRGLDEQIELEQFLQQITHATEDAAEGRQSFLEKREPRFKGR